MKSAIEINPIEIMQLKVAVNTKMEKLRKELGLEAHGKRIDQGDLKVILIELANMGFSVVRTQKK